MTEYLAYLQSNGLAIGFLISFIAYCLGLAISFSLKLFTFGG